MTDATKVDKAIDVLGAHRSAQALDKHLRNIQSLVDTMQTYGNERGDPVRVIQGYLGDRWSSLIMHLLNGGALRFGELRRLIQLLAAESTISHQVLGQKLRLLQRDGLVSRVLLKEPSPHVEYHLTEMGRGAYLHFSALVQWSQDMTAAIRAARIEYDAGNPEGEEIPSDDA